jgi:hypothetical protein
MKKKKFQNSMNKLEFGMMFPKSIKPFYISRSLLNLNVIGRIACNEEPRKPIKIRKTRKRIRISMTCPPRLLKLFSTKFYATNADS